MPPPVVGASPARRLRDALEPIAMHAVWSRRTNERLAGLGLDFFAGYVWGRAAALGEPTAGVVVSSFAVFEPAMLAAASEHGRTACSRDDLLAERSESTIESLHDVLGGVDITPIADRLAGAVTTLASASVAGRPLFAGLVEQPWPEDPYGRLWRGCDLLREHRGDGHIAACIAAGLGSVTMNVLTELWVGMPLGSYSARGWTAEHIAAAAEGLHVDGMQQGDELSRTAGSGVTVSRQPPTTSSVPLLTRSATASMPSLPSSTSGPPAASQRKPFRPTHSARCRLSEHWTTISSALQSSRTFLAAKSRPERQHRMTVSSLPPVPPNGMSFASRGYSRSTRRLSSVRGGVVDDCHCIACDAVVEPDSPQSGVRLERGVVTGSACASTSRSLSPSSASQPFAPQAVRATREVGRHAVRRVEGVAAALRASPSSRHSNRECTTSKCSSRLIDTRRRHVGRDDAGRREGGARSAPRLSGMRLG